jgi:hypothetical protein
MKALIAIALACVTPGLSVAATLTGSIVDSSAAVNLAAVGPLDWARWPGYTHKSTLISNVTTTGTLKTYTNDPRLIGDNSGVKVAGTNASFRFTVAASTIERTLTYYIGGWNSTGRVTVTLPGAQTYTTTFTSATTYSRVVTVKYRADAPGTLNVVFTQTAGSGSINMQAAALSTIGGSTTLTWQPPAFNVDGTPLSNLTAFNVYWGTTPGTYPNSTSIAHIAGTATRSHTVTGLGTGTWYFVVTALNAKGIESPYSNAWSKTVP